MPTDDLFSNEALKLATSKTNFTILHERDDLTRGRPEAALVHILSLQLWKLLKVKRRKANLGQPQKYNNFVFIEHTIEYITDIWEQNIHHSLIVPTFAFIFVRISLKFSARAQDSDPVFEAELQRQRIRKGDSKKFRSKFSALSKDWKIETF